MSFFLPSFLPFLFVFFGSPTSRAGGRIVTILRLVDVFCAKDVPFGVRIFNFHILTQIQDGGRTPYRKSFFFAISRRHIGQLMRISEWKWRITCRYRARDENGNFRKFRMGDDRHFENSFISICQSRIIRFPSNLVCRCKFPFRGWPYDKNRNFSS